MTYGDIRLEIMADLVRLAGLGVIQCCRWSDTPSEPFIIVTNGEGYGAKDGVVMDRIGTVRREDHEGEYSIFLLVRTFDGSSLWRRVYSTVSGHTDWSCRDTEFDTTGTYVVGVVPGTPAATAETSG